MMFHNQSNYPVTEMGSLRREFQSCSYLKRGEKNATLTRQLCRFGFWSLAHDISLWCALSAQYLLSWDNQE